ncbi:MAG: HNH endonuclease [Candidatus Kapabacteria bacterium]|nr:HNH endonuclease [Candidatus Kapabacteria bacterium]
MKPKKREIVWLKYDGRCAYCGDEIDYENMQIDHINPLARGGKNEMDNYNPSCRSCNFYKADFALWAFREQLMTIIQRLEKLFIVRMAIKFNIIKLAPFDGKFYFEKLVSKNNLYNNINPKKEHNEITCN